jgi:hypothetical protein
LIKARAARHWADDMAMATVYDLTLNKALTFSHISYIEYYRT